MRPTPPPRDGVVRTVEVVRCKPCPPSHEEAAVQVEVAALLLAPCEYVPLTHRREKKTTSSHNQ